jgi:hypothetical protein
MISADDDKTKSHPRYADVTEVALMIDRKKEHPSPFGASTA